ncbi:MAG: hypothetical protein H6Q72_3699 [Firmicutes bacterium]|nr:hypothetical protein [Bacillota bacterium]
MSDIKLFKLINNSVTEMEAHSFAIEKSLQTLMEMHLEGFLGVRFLASEYSTGKTHAGRIDTLGIDENGCPVIIEFKRAVNENVINQGLYYLDWLMDHKAEFKLLAMEKIGVSAAELIEWLSPRLLCIAGDFTKYDIHAVQQINRNIELIRYRRYGEELFLLELINATVSNQPSTPAIDPGKPQKKDKTVSEYLEGAKPSLRDLYEAVEAFLIALGDDVQKKVLNNYFAFQRIKNFACVEVHPQKEKLLIYVKINPDTVTLETNFSRDVSKIGHFGTGDLELTVRNIDDMEKAKAYIIQSYEAS